LLVVPGPAVLYIVASSIDGGRRAGAASMLGIQAGALVHVAAAALGLSGILAASALAFDTVKYLGAAYLVGIGLWTLLRGGSPTDPEDAPERPRYRRRFAQGVVVQILNPKTALFFLAFLPQFVDPDAGHAGLQMLVLGLVFVALAILSDGTWVLVAGTASERLRAHRGFLRTQRYVSGTVFVGLGVATALSGGRKP
jgi:threonine/homoserine/homoserine lactone efflux protein